MDPPPPLQENGNDDHSLLRRLPTVALTVQFILVVVLTNYFLLMAAMKTYHVDVFKAANKVGVPSWVWLIPICPHALLIGVWTTFDMIDMIR